MTAMARVALLLSALAVLFLLAGAARCIAARRMVPQGRAWLVTGTMFGAVALWLHFA